MTFQPSSNDFTELPSKLAQLAELGQSCDVTRLVLRRQGSIAWLLGARSHVPQTLDSTCFDVIVDLSDEPTLTIVTNAIEAPRLADTELSGLDADWQVVDWFANRADHWPRGAGVATDLAFEGALDLSAQLADLRRVLTPTQQQTLREVARDAAEAFTQIAPLLTPDMTEYHACGMLAMALMERSLDPVVMLAAGHDRIADHRHPLPLDREVGQRLMLVTCARRDGLIASLTRTYSFGPIDAAQREALDSLFEVEAAFLDNTVAGRPIGEIFANSITAYAANGFDADEWHRHHQGGFTGWETREFTANLHSRQIAEAGSAVAWNQSGRGWKAENTCIVTPTGPEVLDLDPNWPSIVVHNRQRPDVFEI